MLGARFAACNTWWGHRNRAFEQQGMHAALTFVEQFDSPYSL